jgi:hypothetical protein
VAKAVKKQAEFGAALAELGVASAALARHEGADAPRELVAALGALGDKGSALGRAAAAGADRLTASVSTPLAACVRSVKAARATMADRGSAGGTLAAARNDVDARRARLTRLRATGGVADAKVRREMGIGWRGRGKARDHLPVFFLSHTHASSPFSPLHTDGRSRARPPGRPDRRGGG